MAKGISCYGRGAETNIRFDKDFVSARKQQKLRRAKLQESRVNTEPNFRDDLDAYEATWYGMNANYEDRVI